jgi:carboxypeptidase Taq
LGDVSPEDFLRAVNEVKPSHIRVEADEVTYNLHIILRFKLERELISGSLLAADIPPAWNESFRKLLLLDVPDDTRGCLQDTHWASGLFGYFPTYCLGNLYAAQFFKKAGQDIPDLEDLVERGDFKSLFAWLRENIHCHGMRYHPRELVEKITGSTPGTEPFLDYLRVKYSKLYDF